MKTSVWINAGRAALTCVVFGTACERPRLLGEIDDESAVRFEGTALASPDTLAFLSDNRLVAEWISGESERLGGPEKDPTTRIAYLSLEGSLLGEVSSPPDLSAAWPGRERFRSSSARFRFPHMIRRAARLSGEGQLLVDAVGWAFNADGSEVVRVLPGEKPGIEDEAVVELWELGSPPRLVWERRLPIGGRALGPLVEIWENASGPDRVVVAPRYGGCFVLSKTSGEVQGTLAYDVISNESERRAFREGPTGRRWRSFDFLLPNSIAFDSKRGLLACGDSESAAVRVFDVEAPAEPVFEAGFGFGRFGLFTRERADYLSFSDDGLLIVEVTVFRDRSAWSCPRIYGPAADGRWKELWRREEAGSARHVCLSRGADWLGMIRGGEIHVERMSGLLVRASEPDHVPR